MAWNFWYHFSARTRSIAANSSGVNDSLLRALTSSTSWLGRLAPTRTQAISGSRTQEDKVCIKVMEEMAQYITSILKSAPQIVMSWGYHQPSVYKEDGMEGLRFRVQGFKHTGYVAVLYNPGSDYFEVELQDDMGHAKTRVEDVCFTELVDKIDELVERTDNYDADIEVWKNTPESDPDKQAAKDLGKLVCELQELGIGGDIIIID